eukprot:scaffold409494_cov38-Prasinocladus_malaysianus.AAC.2
MFVFVVVVAAVWLSPTNQHFDVGGQRGEHGPHQHRQQGHDPGPQPPGHPAQGDQRSPPHGSG